MKFLTLVASLLFASVVLVPANAADYQDPQFERTSAYEGRIVVTAPAFAPLVLHVLQPVRIADRFPTIAPVVVVSRSTKAPSPAVLRRADYTRVCRLPKGSQSGGL